MIQPRYLPNRMPLWKLSIFGFLAIALALLPSAAALAQPTVGDPTLDSLLSDLEGGDALAQEQAGQELAAIGTTAVVPRLVEVFLATDNPRPAAVALAGIGSPSAMNALVEALAGEELTALRNAAQVALLEASERAVVPLMLGLRDSEPTVRRHSAQLLGFIGSPRAVNVLVVVADNDPDPLVRQEAVWALGAIGEARVRLSLKAIARSDPEPAVRVEAQRALLRLGETF